ncbi:MAG TPA: hypothetical protein PKM12_00565, partial [Marmoricola sp.]|nr:hypothetical protein [Marmoricola sp.]
MTLAVLITLVMLLAFAVVVLAKTVRIIPQARAGIVERFGKYRSTLNPGLNMVVPFVDKDGVEDEDGCPEPDPSG